MVSLSSNERFMGRRIHGRSLATTAPAPLSAKDAAAQDSASGSPVPDQGVGQASRAPGPAEASGPASAVPLNFNFPNLSSIALLPDPFLPDTYTPPVVGAVAPAPSATSALSAEPLVAMAPAAAVPSALGPLPSGPPTLVIPTQPVPAGESGNSTSVPDYGQCGGSGVTCPLADKAACADAAYLACAVATSACTRINKYYWQARFSCCTY